MPAPGETFGKYDLRREVGRGGMGVVYEAANRETGETVALKIIPRFMSGKKEIYDRFLREARATAYLSHRNIAAFREVGEIDGSSYFAMEYVEGRPLRDRFPALPAPESDVIGLIVQLASAVQHAHSSEYGVIHRDLKPENLLVTADDRLVVIDFGFSKIINEATLTLTGSRFGTPAYMAPEQFNNARTIDHRSDLWAIGVIFYELLTGRRPIEDETDLAILRALNDPTRQIAPPRELNPGISQNTERIVMRLLAKSPGDRYGSAAQLLADIEGKDATPAVRTYEMKESFRIGDRIEHPVMQDAGWVIHKDKPEEGRKITRVTIDWDRSGIRSHASEMKESLSEDGLKAKCGACSEKTPAAQSFCIHCGAERTEPADHPLSLWEKVRVRVAWASAVLALCMAAAVWMATRAPLEERPGAPSPTPPSKVAGLVGFDIEGDIVGQFAAMGISVEKTGEYGRTKIFRAPDRRYNLWCYRLLPGGPTLMAKKPFELLKQSKIPFYLILDTNQPGEILVVPGSVFSEDVVDERKYQTTADRVIEQIILRVKRSGEKWLLTSKQHSVDLSEFLNAFDQLRR